MKGILINYEYCTGCHSCEVACKKHLELPKGEFGIKLTEVGPYAYSGRELGKDKHFTQYSALSCVLDINKFKVMSEELTEWMSSLSSFGYQRDETKDHVNKLRKGFGDMKSYA